jgi:hypothetical protein
MSSYGPLTKDTSSVLAGLAQVRVGNSAVNIKTVEPVLTGANSIGALASTKFNSNAEYLKLESGFPLMEDLSIPTRELANLECAFKEITITNMALARGLDPTDTEIGNYADVGTIVHDPAKMVVPGNADVVQTWTLTGDGTDTITVSGSISGAPVTGGSGVITAELACLDANDNVLITIPADFITAIGGAADTVTFDSTLLYANDHDGTVGLGGMSAPAYVRVECVYTYPNGQTLTVIFPRANVVSSVELEGQLEDFAAAPITLEAKRSDGEVDGGDVLWNDMPLGSLYFATS